MITVYKPQGTIRCERNDSIGGMVAKARKQLAKKLAKAPISAVLKQRKR